MEVVSCLRRHFGHLWFMHTDTMKQNLLEQEIQENITEILYRQQIINTLKQRIQGMGQRRPELSYEEYDTYWHDFWHKRDIFRTDLPFVYYDKPISPHMTPFLAKKLGIVTILKEKIEQYKFKTILEIGSGAALNLMMLAPLFPNVNFFGLEPTASGVNISTEFINNPPPEFKEAYDNGPLKNITIIRGSILEKETLIKLKSFDFIFTCAVLEQIHNDIELCFQNIFNIANSYFLFYEEWREANYILENYKTLVDNDYFRISWNYLNSFQDIQILERTIPAIQPSWLKYGTVFCKKIKLI
jgi:tRNA G46 methylase TrmB